MKRKVCIVFQGNFVQMGHALALELKNKYGVEEICGYVFSEHSYSFLRAQKDIVYTKLLLDSDVHQQFKTEKIDRDYVQVLEKKYGTPNLWPYLYVDRKIMNSIPPQEYTGKYLDPLYSYEEMIQIVQCRFRAVEQFLSSEKPDCLLFSLMGTVGHLALKEVGKKMNIPSYNIDLARIANLFTWSEDYNTLTGVEEVFHKLQSAPNVKPTERAQTFLRTFRENQNLALKLFPVSKSPLDRFAFLLPQNIFKNIRFIVQMAWVTYKQRNAYEYSYAFTDPYHYLKHKIALKLRGLRGFNDLYSKPQDEDYAFYPLHAEPEISLLLTAPFWCDQIYTIRQIARSLPLHFKLYVKEHPAMINYRPRWYYKELLAIPNVRLVSPYLKSNQLISKSKLVCVTTGTAGWEASLLKKPVITFGNVYFNTLSFVKQCRTVDELPAIVKEQLENFKYNETELLNLIEAAYAGSVPFNFFDTTGQTTKQILAETGFQELVKMFAEKYLVTV